MRKLADLHSIAILPPGSLGGGEGGGGGGRGECQELTCGARKLRAWQKLQKRRTDRAVKVHSKPEGHFGKPGGPLKAFRQKKNEKPSNLEATGVNGVVATVRKGVMAKQMKVKQEKHMTTAMMETRLSIPRGRKNDSKAMEVKRSSGTSEEVQPEKKEGSGTALRTRRKSTEGKGEPVPKEGDEKTTSSVHKEECKQAEGSDLVLRIRRRNLIHGQGESSRLKKGSGAIMASDDTNRLAALEEGAVVSDASGEMAGTPRKRTQGEGEPVLKKGHVACDNEEVSSLSKEQEKPDQSSATLLRSQQKCVHPEEEEEEEEHVFKNGGAECDDKAASRLERESHEEGMISERGATGMQALELEYTQSQSHRTLSRVKHPEGCNSFSEEKSTSGGVSVKGKSLTHGSTLKIETSEGLMTPACPTVEVAASSADICAKTVKSKEAGNELCSAAALSNSTPDNSKDVIKKAPATGGLTPSHDDPIGNGNGSSNLLQIDNGKDCRFSSQVATLDQSVEQEKEVLVEEGGMPGSRFLFFTSALPVGSAGTERGNMQQSRREGERCIVHAYSWVRKRKRVESAVHHHQRKLLCVVANTDGDGNGDGDGDGGSGSGSGSDSGTPRDRKRPSMPSWAMVPKVHEGDQGGVAMVEDPARLRVSNAQATCGDGPSTARDAAVCGNMAADRPGETNNLNYWDRHASGRLFVHSSVGASGHAGESRTMVQVQQKQPITSCEESRTEGSRQRDATGSFVVEPIRKAVQAQQGRTTPPPHLMRGKQDPREDRNEREKQTKGVGKATTGMEKEPGGEEGDIPGLTRCSSPTTMVQRKEMQNGHCANSMHDGGIGGREAREGSSESAVLHITADLRGTDSCIDGPCVNGAVPLVTLDIRRSESRISGHNAVESPTSEYCLAQREQDGTLHHIYDEAADTGVVQAGAPSGKACDESHLHQQDVQNELRLLDEKEQDAAVGSCPSVRKSGETHATNTDDEPHNRRLLASDRGCGDILPSSVCESDPFRHRNQTIDVPVPSLERSHGQRDTVDCRDTSAMETSAAMEKTWKMEMPQRRSTRVRRSTDTTKCDGIWYAGELTLKAFERRRIVKKKPVKATSSLGEVDCQVPSQRGNEPTSTVPNLRPPARCQGGCNKALQLHHRASFNSRHWSSSESLSQNQEGELRKPSSSVNNDSDSGSAHRHGDGHGQNVDGCIQEDNAKPTREEEEEGGTTTSEAEWQKKRRPELCLLLSTCRQFGQVLKSLANERICSDSNVFGTSTRSKGGEGGDWGRMLEKKHTLTTNGRMGRRNARRESHLCPHCSRVYNCEPRAFHCHVKLCYLKRSEIGTKPTGQHDKTEVARNRRKGIAKRLPAVGNSHMDDSTGRKEWEEPWRVVPMTEDHVIGRHVPSLCADVNMREMNEPENHRHSVSGLHRLTALASVVEGITQQEEAAIGSLLSF
ncbi:hypothetical protein CBR_g19087 [Chara braunii]|uniref:Uncharacterized protein n=1 Tax=Chara braunii TaxID=69332 RepID=A0A388KX75_CHABU|nr:hypothetical protein CBR_g19087 [Chara braunii]|eukprot:GBG74680.1 hypothetical protein CBR_g19087 [Chara braunii]